MSRVEARRAGYHCCYKNYAVQPIVPPKDKP